jgi:hypothetical protein
MPGGLLQIASSGIQDVYLTKNPEITFFKKIYRRPTNFSTEFHKINIDESVKYGDDLFINIPKYGDLLHKSFIKVELPKVILNDSYIKNKEFISLKNNKLKKFQDTQNMWKKEYDSLKQFSDIMIIFYKKIIVLMKSQDITYEKINNESLLLRNSYSDIIKKTVFNIDEDLIDSIDIFSYVINLDRTFSSEDSDTKNTITMPTFIKEIEKLYNNNIHYLKYYYSNYSYYKNKYNTLNEGIIDYAWIKNLGHYYFTDYKLDIDGMHLQNYNDDYLNMYQKHTIIDERLENYNEMIGNIENLTSLNTNKDSIDLYIPLAFWFNTNSMNSLPLISMRHSMVSLNLKIAELNKLLYFTDFKDEFNNLMILEYHKINHNTNKKLPISLVDSNSNINKSDIIKIDYMKDEKIYIYHFNKVTKELLKLKYENLTDTDINNFFSKYSTDTTTISLSDWVNFRINSIDTTDENIKKVCKNINMDKSPFFSDYNYLFSKFKSPKLSLISEYVYLDEIERFRFGKNDLEYVINLPNIITTSIDNEEYFNTDVGILKPTKDMYWFIRPKLLKNGIVKYNYKNPSLYNQYDMINEKILIDNVFMINDFELINFKYGEDYYKKTTKYNKLNSINDSEFYYHSFCLYPEEDQPSGSANFSVIKNLNIILKFNKKFLTEYFNSDINKNTQGFELVFINRSYNLLKFSKGKGSLVFY